MKFKHIFIIILGLALTSCHKDSESLNEEFISTFTAEVVQEIDGTILGYVYDEQNQPVKEATVAIYSATTKTNEFGVFRFKNAKTDKNGTFIKVYKDGFIFGSDMVYPSEKSTVYSYVKMMALELGKTLDSKVGGNISITGGGKVTFPENAFINADGSTYSGTVTVTAKFLNPNDKKLGDVMPGDLVADAANGNTVVLGTLGMVAVELRDNNGKKLNIGNGKKATLEVPAKTPNAPDEIEMWSFDENKGRWKEEGKAKLVNGNYITEVSHFSFWNCDAPFPLIHVCGKIVKSDGSPGENITVKVEVEGLGSRYGYTDSEGEFCGKMPKGKKFTISVSSYNCLNDLNTVMVGPFQNNTILDNIVLNDVPTNILTGQIHCNNTPVTEGVIVMKINETTFLFESKEDGSFRYDLTSFLCGENYPISIFGYNSSNNEASTTLSLTSTNLGGVSLNVCNADCNMVGEITYDCDEKITIDVTGGSGNYTYLWNDNLTTTKSIILNPLDSLFEGSFCVTVTDVSNNCEKIYCKDINGKPYVFIGNECMGELFSGAYSGTPPYSFLWSNGATTQNLLTNNFGNYCLTVTDASGCSASACKEWNGGPTLDNTPSSCTGNMFDITSSPFDNGNYFGQNTGSNIYGTVNFPIVIDVFKTGFQFGITIGDASQCSATQQFNLPRLVDGLTATVVNTTCGTCEDGKININLVQGANCIQCNVGATKVFKVTNTSIDLSAQNNAGMLSKGEYYVVVLDATTGCYIAINKVKII